jgi:hypothetical protein
MTPYEIGEADASAGSSAATPDMAAGRDPGLM